MQFENKHIVITGGSKGIGAACVKAFLEAGARVAILDIDASEQDKALFFKCDVADEIQIKSCFESIEREWGGVDVLINNAGIQRYGSVTETDSELWDLVMNVNLKSMFLCARYALPSMQRRGGGVIINVSSVQAFHSQEKVAAYTTAKTAVLGLTRSIAVDYAPGIRCMAVCPGTIDTPMLREAAALSTHPEEVIEECNQMHLTKRIGTAEEVASLIQYLCSREAAFMTGQAVRIDGGLGIVIQGSKKD